MELRYGFLFVTTVLVGYIHAQTEELQYDMHRAKKYCGSRLAQELSTICRGNYNTIHKKQDIYQKKSYWDEQYSTDMQNGNLAYPLQKRSIATSLMGANYKKRKRRNRGVYNECCEKSCSREELSLYCAQPSTRRR